jgi:hypothetical protein
VAQVWIAVQRGVMLEFIAWPDGSRVLNDGAATAT